MSDVYDQESDQAQPPKAAAPTGSLQLTTGILAAGAVTMLIAGAAIGWTIKGSPNPPTTPSACAEATTAIEKYMRAADQASAGSTEKQRNARLYLRVVEQNPSCFSAEVRAIAEEALNRP